MNIYYVINNYDGCYYVRCLLPQRYNNWDGDLSCLSDRIDRESSGVRALQNDVIVFHRPDSNKAIKLMELLKEAGKTVVFENDDTYKGDKDFSHNGLNTKKIYENTNRAIKIADLVTCSTETLAKEYRQIHDKVVVLPNCVDQFDWAEPLRNETNKIRVGIVGSTTMNGDFESAYELLKDLSEDDRFQLVMFGLPERNPTSKAHAKLISSYDNDFDWWGQFNIEWQPFVRMCDYFDTLNELRLDAMLIPRKESYFNKCKSNIKFLEASMLEIPVVAQSFKDAPYEEIENGVTGYKTKDFKVKDLLLDKKKLREIGKNAKKYVLTNYDITKKAHLWLDAYSEVYQKNED